MSQNGEFASIILSLTSDMFESDHLDKDDESQEQDDFYGGKFDFVPRSRANRHRAEGENNMFKLRACISCRLIMSEEQFFERGCGNCAFLQMDGDRRRTLDCTSSNFSGLISIMDPQKSWAARFNNLGDVIPGCYAISVVGELPESIHDEVRH
ncbi:Transcription elongation factor SPT4 -like protein 2 [Babesia sp. Xinjiang]|uniref:Transcription elongation factor SPT4 -like protein 2 n=1 Tax=Babesia sp. Xinjiang TaxID=462227 RepID=UPI000A220310|nr:Transcription elongation factor SPT4 -like protein 2 [Babesia sp. Xinjiang]ORM40382.1 Transcription elongation factor SPT4 -like protein 2 [Babesia sp. Xinjiang]